MKEGDGQKRTNSGVVMTVLTFLECFTVTKGLLVYFLLIPVFGVPKDPLGEVLEGDCYPHFAGEEMEVPSALGIVQNCVVQRKKELDLSPPSPEPQVWALSSCPCCMRAEDSSLLSWWRKIRRSLIG